MPDTADDLMGNNLQIFVSKTFDALRAEVWLPEVNQAVTSASCDVENQRDRTGERCVHSQFWSGGH